MQAIKASTDPSVGGTAGGPFASSLPDKPFGFGYTTASRLSLRIHSRAA